MWTESEYVASISDYQNDIYMRDISSSKVQITTDLSDQGNPAIHGNIIVWTDYRNVVGSDGNTDIYAYDLSTSTEIPICTDTSKQNSPDVYGDIIVWRDSRNGGSDVYMYDLSTLTETRISTATSYDPCSSSDPAIYDNIIVWTDYRNGNYDIYMYDLDTETEAPICTDPNRQSSVSIYENLVIWTDYRNGITNGDIYMGEITILTGADEAEYHLEDLQDEIDDLSPTDFKPSTGDRQADLIDKIDEIIDKINAGQYKEAFKKLTKDILPKLDDSSKQTWLLGPQPELLEIINKIIDILNSLL